MRHYGVPLLVLHLEWVTGGGITQRERVKKLEHFERERDQKLRVLLPKMMADRRSLPDVSRLVTYRCSL